jgi:diguanylate cyclase (GGDEF)-like protein
MTLFVLSHASLYFIEKSQIDSQIILMTEYSTFFEKDVEETFQNNVDLLKGFIAYLETTGEFDTEQSNLFLDRLFENEKTLIRNISIIEDTTIIWAYPSVGNEGAIGKNLALIPEQSDDVLLVKEKNTIIAIGPITLVQGGEGFIVRMPLIREGIYWGQMSIVIDANKFYEEIENYSTIYSIKSAIYKDVNGDDILVFDGGIIELDNAIIIEANIMGIDYKFYSEPLDGWKDNSTFFWIMRLVALLLSLIAGSLIYWTFEKKNAMKRVAFIDTLTNLDNRYSLGVYLNSIEFKEKLSEHLVVAIIDLDGFKRINDDYGHDVGDKVLIDFSIKLLTIPLERMKIFRLGGDEFLVLFQDRNPHESLDSLQKLFHEKLNYKYYSDTLEIQVGASIGISSTFDGDDIGVLMKKADQRMYIDKEKNKSN